MTFDNDLIKFQHIIQSLQGKDEIKVLFVCLGNICRSPAAEGLMLDIVRSNNDSHRWIIDSAGTGNYHTGDLPDHRMRVHARRRGIELTHHARQVTTDDFFDFDIIIGMDDSNIERLRRIAPSTETADKVLPMAIFFRSYTHFDHVPDPYYDGAQGFETVLDLLSDATASLYDSVTSATTPDR